MGDIKEKVKEICTMREDLTKKMKAWMDMGVEHVDTKEAGEIVDMIKDLSEVEKNLYEACYYKSIDEAMHPDYDEEMAEDRYGYNHRHTSSGRFARSGQGHVVGYHPPHMDHIMHEYLENPEEFSHRMRMGYSNDGGYGTKSDMMDGSYNRRGYDHDMMEDRYRHGEAYDGYRRARRHYTESKSPEEKAKMEEHTKMYVEDTMRNLREMWDDADPTLRKQMKENLAKLVGNMNS